MLHEKVKACSTSSGRKSRRSRRRSRSTFNDAKSFNECRKSMQSLSGRSSYNDEGAMVTKDGHVVSKNSMKNARFRAAFDYSPKFSEKPMFSNSRDPSERKHSEEELAVTEI